MVARLLKAGTGTRVYYARQGGYDTHAGQYGRHYQLPPPGLMVVAQ